MFIALGSGSVTAAMLYLFVHGFFKALLFLGAGSVIHATHKQEIDELGGLASKMPVTAITFAIGTGAMIGLIPLSGFWAKDEVLVYAEEEQHLIVYLLILASLVVTGLYMARLFIRTFLFAPRDEHSWEHAHEGGPLITVPLIILGILAAIGGFVVLDEVGEAMGFAGGFGQFVFEHGHPHEYEFHSDTAIISTVLAGGGALLGWVLWQGKAEVATRVRETFPPISALLANRFYIDEIYQFGIDRVVMTLSAIVSWFDRNIVNDTGVDGSAGLGYFSGFELKFLQTGKIPNYALAISAGILILALVMIATQV
jgi:NADH-quinone oxidoreductase subunit L